MATLILGGIGAAVGSAFGGPAGARLGFSIGAAVGGLLDAPKGVDQQTGKLDDLRTTTSDYGTAIPLVWGNMGVGGNVIWATPLKEHKHSQHQGGKGLGGATSTSYTYSVSLAILVCDYRPGLSVSKIVANDLTIWQAGHSGNTITPRFYDGNEAQMPDALIAAAQSDGQAPAFRGLNYFVLENFDLSNFGNSIPNFQIETTQAGVTVGSILTDLSLMTGLASTDFDYSGATDAVCGMMIGSRGAVSDTVTPLLASYLTDLIEADGILKAVKRGGPSAMTISLADLGASESTEATTLLTETRMQEVELPWRVDVTYYSAETGKSYEQGSQGAIRIGALQQQANTVDLPLSLHDSDARAVAEQQLHQAWTERSPTQLTLPPRYLALAPADIITLPPGDGLLVYDGIGSQTRRLRITDMSINLPGILSLSCVDDDAALPAMIQPPGSRLLPATTTLLSAVNTSFTLWSGTELRDSDQGIAGFYLAATGGAGWPGAQVYYSVNGMDWIAAGNVSGRSVFGTATSALANGAAGSSFDTSDTVSVSVNGVLESVSQSEVLSGLNTARLGSEIFGFENAALVTAGNYPNPSAYTLGTLDRALRASVGTGHTSGEPFVLLDPDALLRVTVPAALIGQTVQVKCVSNYQALSDVAAQSVTIAVPTPTAAQAGITNLQNQINNIQTSGGASPLATTSVFGLVETDITEPNGSTVYSKTTADSKFATQAALTSEQTARVNADALALQKSQNLADLPNAGTARSNLGLGTAAQANLPAAGSNASAGQVVRGDDTRLGSGGGTAPTTTAQKRRIQFTFYPDASYAGKLNLNQILRFPHTTDQGSATWQPLGNVIVHAETAGGGTISVQISTTASTNGWNQAVLLAPAATVSGSVPADGINSSSYTANPNVNTGTQIAATWSGIPAGAAGVYCTSEWQEV